MRRPGRRARAAKRSPGPPRQNTGAAPRQNTGAAPPAGTFPPTGQGAAESKDEASRGERAEATDKATEKATATY